MFVKIIWPGSEATIETVYECDRYEVRFYMNENPQSCMVKMKKEGKHVATVKIEKADVAVYFMNENGKTIDSIDWLDHRVDAVDVPMG